MTAPVLPLLLSLVNAESGAEARPPAKAPRAAQAAAEAAEAAAPAAPAPAQSLGDLEQSGVVKSSASLENLRSGLIAAQQDLVTGNVQTATTRLFALVESPAFGKFRNDPEYQNAELTLGRALVRGGAYGAGERYLMRVLARGPKRPFFAPAYRAMADVALESREEGAVLARLDAAAPPESLPRDSANERAYLAGKAAYGAGNHAGAARLFEDVDRQSRFFAAALYFRGLVDARSKHYVSARRSLCEIVEQEDRSQFTFFVDGRYFAIKDLAYLALGRIAHEQGKFDDAYYFYFRVPEDSERLPEALYEASWSMFQKGEYEAARAFIEQFDRSFPGSPLAPDVLLLRAMINLKSCKFDAVRTTLDTFVSTYVPIEAEVAQLIAEPERRRTLYRRLLGRQRIGRTGDPIIELLKLDARFFRYYAYLLDLDREAGLVPQAVAVWDELTAARAGDGGKSTDADARGAQATEAVQLVAEIDALVGEIKVEENADLRDEATDLLMSARRAARPVSPGGPFADEAEKLSALGGDARKLRARLVDAVSALAEAALIDLDRRLRGLLRQARLTHIDAIIGKKKRLEIEIANLQEGRYPTEMLGRLEVEGLIGDDEEYWPYEGEYWADEYENYR
jgi:tetratricopeptide (TPR) repeat protein